ncbi:hypothetical protein NL676_036929 [Syzygium grande]|nr:hypothetical protein NL676_036929 [Syzygium grande]
MLLGLAGMRLALGGDALLVAVRRQAGCSVGQGACGGTGGSVSRCGQMAVVRSGGPSADELVRFWVEVTAAKPSPNNGAIGARLADGSNPREELERSGETRPDPALRGLPGLATGLRMISGMQTDEMAGANFAGNWVEMMMLADDVRLVLDLPNN